MAYTKTTWSASTPLSEDNLAHLETQADALDTEMLAVDHSEDYYTIAEYAATFYAFPGAGHGSGQDAGTLGGLTKAELLASSVPKDTVIMWHGNIVSVPAGFAYCDGTGDILDMKDRLPLGGNYNVGDPGGAAETEWTGSVNCEAHTLTIQELPKHLHTWNDHYPCDSSYCNDAGVNDAGGYPDNRWSDYKGGGGSHNHTAYLGGDSNDNYPAVKAVHFLIKT